MDPLVIFNVPRDVPRQEVMRIFSLEDHNYLNVVGRKECTLDYRCVVQREKLSWFIDFYDGKRPPNKPTWPVLRVERSQVADVQVPYNYKDVPLVLARNVAKIPMEAPSVFYFNHSKMKVEADDWQKTKQQLNK